MQSRTSADRQDRAIEKAERQGAEKDIREQIEESPMKKMYSVTYLSRPTFYLDPNVQGIVCEAQAERVACTVMDVDVEEAIENGLAVILVEVE